MPFWANGLFFGGLFLFCFYFLMVVLFVFFVLFNILPYMNLEERINQFKAGVETALRHENPTTVSYFLDYWTEHSLNARKFRAEKEKVFDVKKRFATWQRNQIKWFPEKQGKMQTFLTNYEIAKQNL